MIGEQIVEIVAIVVEKGWRERKVKKMRTSRVVQDGRERVDTEWFEIVDESWFKMGEMAASR